MTNVTVKYMQNTLAMLYLIMNYPHSADLLTERIKYALPFHKIDGLSQFAFNSIFYCTCLRCHEYEQPIFTSLPKLDLLKFQSL